jgi:hypothetical protein
MVGRACSRRQEEELRVFARRVPRLWIIRVALAYWLGLVRPQGRVQSVAESATGDMNVSNKELLPSSASTSGWHFGGSPPASPLRLGRPRSSGARQGEARPKGRQGDSVRTGSATFRQLSATPRACGPLRGSSSLRRRRARCDSARRGAERFLGGEPIAQGSPARSECQEDGPPSVTALMSPKPNHQGRPHTHVARWTGSF